MLNLCCLVGCHIGCLLYGTGGTEADGPRGVSAGGRTKSAGVLMQGRAAEIEGDVRGDDS